MKEESRQLALEIVGCPVVAAVLRGVESPCRSVVTFQKRPAAERWVPEPWSGHLDSAPILFLSSNPSSGDPDEPYRPDDLTASSGDEAILNTFDRAFDEGPWIGISRGTHLRAADGTPGKYVA